MQYVKKVPHADGIYSGFMKDNKRHGLGTWVNKDSTERYEG